MKSKFPKAKYAKELYRDKNEASFLILLEGQTLMRSFKIITNKDYQAMSYFIDDQEITLDEYSWGHALLELSNLHHRHSVPFDKEYVLLTDTKEYWYDLKYTCKADLIMRTDNALSKNPVSKEKFLFIEKNGKLLAITDQNVTKNHPNAQGFMFFKEHLGNGNLVMSPNLEDGPKFFG